MKSIRKDLEKLSKAYPKLMTNIEYDSIILVTSHGVGTIVSVGYTNHKLGYHSSNWSIDDLTDYNGEVTLSN